MKLTLRLIAIATIMAWVSVTIAGVLSGEWGMNINQEPTFLGVNCCGKNIEKANQLKEEAEARILLSYFYSLNRNEQLILAAASEQINKNLKQN